MTDFTKAQPTNLAEQSSVDERAKALALKAAQDKRVIRELLSTPIGRNWTWHLLEQCHMLSTSFAEEPTVMAFREGERNIGLRLWSQIQQDAPELLLTMLAEKGVANG